jgi:16S rRNA (uracil1498-N3)-methyltransferase
VVAAGLCYAGPIVNQMLFSLSEWGQPLAPSDPRYRHGLKILGLKPGDQLKVGLLNYGSGSAQVRQFDAQGLVLDFPSTLTPPPARLGIRLLLGHVRPLVLQRLFKDFASLGVAEIWVINAGLTEGSYFQSSFWQHDEYQRFLLEGAEQGGDVVLPQVRRFYSFQAAIAALPAPVEQGRYIFHPGPYPLCPHQLLSQAPAIVVPSLSLGSNQTPQISLTLPPSDLLSLAIGPERGWTAMELSQAQDQGFMVYSLGPRILRTELVASALLTLASLGSQQR